MLFFNLVFVCSKTSGIDSFVQEMHGEWRLLATSPFLSSFGFFQPEFLASTKRFSAWRRIGLATLAGFGLSMCIECLQLVLRLVFFEVTDLVMNTVGAGVGAGLAAGVRGVGGKRGKEGRI